MKKIIFANNFDMTLIKKTGFDGVFFKHFSNEKLALEIDNAIKNDVEISSIHADFSKVNLLYSNNSTPAINSIKSSIDWASKFEIKTVVMHPTYLYDLPEFNSIAYKNFSTLFDYAQSRKVLVCIENMELSKHVFDILDAFKSHPACGFCWDTGHYFAYTPNANFYTLKPSYLHLNDNYGMTSNSAQSIDDAHLIPFDGKIDFYKVCSHLKNVGYNNDLVFEVKKNNPTKNGFSYKSMSDEEFLLKAFDSAIKIESLIKE